MSHTVRRKTGYIRPWDLQEYVSRTSKYGGEYWERVALEGKAWKKQWNFLHRDGLHNCYIGNTPRHWRNIEHRKHRTQCKTQIANYIKNEEYEVILTAGPIWDYWD
jgi:hypothetical protein